MASLDQDGRSALHYAAGAEGDDEQVQRLLAGGIEVGLADRNGWTPLHFAAAANRATTARLLLDAGAAVDAKDHDGNTPLFRAVFAYAGDGTTITTLRDAGANPLLTNASDQSPVGLARLIATSDVARFFNDMR